MRTLRPEKGAAGMWPIIVPAGIRTTRTKLSRARYRYHHITLRTGLAKPALYEWQTSHYYSGQKLSVARRIRKQGSSW
jgi:hypothetical protein